MTIFSDCRLPVYCIPRMGEKKCADIPLPLFRIIVVLNSGNRTVRQLYHHLELSVQRGPLFVPTEWQHNSNN